MPKYRLVYFQMKARGEIIRYLFKAAGVPFEDFRVSVNGVIPGPEYAEIKKNSPFGQLPLLEVDGEELAQSHAIERYLAREFGMDGATSLEKAKCDMWIEAADELIRRISDNVEEHDPKRKEEDKNKVKTVIAPKILGTLDKTISKNGSGFIVGNKLTVADLAWLSVRDWLGSGWGEEGLALLKPFNNVTAHMDKIAAIPAIANWIKTRPESPY